MPSRSFCQALRLVDLLEPSSLLGRRSLGLQNLLYSRLLLDVRPLRTLRRAELCGVFRGGCKTQTTRLWNLSVST